MDLELDEIFQWQTPFCALLGDIGVIPEDGIDSMLDQMELPEIQDDTLAIVPGAAGDAVVSSTNLSSSTLTGSTEEPVSSPLWPCDLRAAAVDSNSFLPPVQAIEKNLSSASNFDPVGSPQSSTAPFKGANSLTASQGSHEGAPVTPPAAKPKRTRASKAASKKSAKKSCQGVGAVAEQPKAESRLPTQAEHIIRERQRRDDMSHKYLILESLLPSAPKRERAVVVEHAIVFVKELQQKRNELLKRRANLKSMPSSQSPRLVPSKKLTPLHDSPGVITASCMKLHSRETCGTDSPISSSMMAQQELITSPAIMNPVNVSADPSSGSVQQLLQVHVHFSEEEIVIEMICLRPRQNFQSFLLQAVESFGLDVTRCSIHRVLHGFVQCTISCIKSQAVNPSLTSSEVQTSATLIGALRNVLTQS